MTGEIVRGANTERSVRSMQRYYRAKLLGICCYCYSRKRPIVPGRIYCEKCRDKKRAYVRRINPRLKEQRVAEYRMYRDNGICCRCRKRDVTTGSKSVCYECLLYYRKWKGITGEDVPGRVGRPRIKKPSLNELPSSRTGENIATRKEGSPSSLSWPKTGKI